MYKKILAVDDDKETLEMLRDLLLRYDYKVETLSKAENIFQAVARFKPDLILLDIMLAGLDGTIICSALKSAPETRHIPIIFISGNYQAASRLLESTEGAPDDFVLKPFDVQALINKIQFQLAA
ncbi:MULTISPECIES: response regulator [unclassified Mucilaginibacter]|uniref:response regulator n=1 Tax=unclassified Mucilaginibacter TaxID=2617802 RepID=UPI0031F6102B